MLLDVLYVLIWLMFSYLSSVFCGITVALIFICLLYNIICFLPGETEVQFTYEVNWEASDIRWASRWDTYLAMSDVQIHWFSIINSVVVVFFLAGILTMIIVRTLRRDIAKYNKIDDEVCHRMCYHLSKEIFVCSF